MRKREDIEAEIDDLREYVRSHPTMRAYIEPKREALRQELRATMGIKEKDNSVFYFVSGIFLVLAAIAGIATYAQ